MLDVVQEVLGRIVLLRIGDVEQSHPRVLFDHLLRSCRLVDAAAVVEEADALLPSQVPQLPQEGQVLGAVERADQQFVCYEALDAEDRNQCDSGSRYWTGNAVGLRRFLPGQRPLLLAHQLRLVHEEQLHLPLDDEAQMVHQAFPLEYAFRLRRRAGQWLLNDLVLANESEDGTAI